MTDTEQLKKNSPFPEGPHLGKEQVLYADNQHRDCVEQYALSLVMLSRARPGAFHQYDDDSNILGRIHQPDRKRRGRRKKKKKTVINSATTCAAGLKKTRRCRATAEQLRVLEAFFYVNRLPSRQEVGRLATETDMSVARIKNWFRNRRARAKAATASSSSTSHIFDNRWHGLSQCGHQLSGSYNQPQFVLPLMYTRSICQTDDHQPPFLPHVTWHHHHHHHHHWEKV